MTTTIPVTVVCSRAINMTVTLDSTPANLPALDQHEMHTTVDLATSGQYGMVLLSWFICRDTMKGSFGLAIVPQQQQP